MVAKPALKKKSSHRPDVQRQTGKHAASAPSDQQFTMILPIGAVAITHDHHAICTIQFLAKIEQRVPRENTSFEAQIKEELNAYFAHPRHRWQLSLSLQVTPFQHQVLTRLRQIPAGETCTYGALAKELGSSARAIGNACRHNPIPILIPCHRVVSKTGIGGFNGKTQGSCIAIKQFLLRHEKAI